jgi:uncharacterized damage-inducible protein DinB
MDLRSLFAYSENARHLLRETLESNPEVFDATFETCAGRNSIRGLLAHILGAEERWIEVRIGGRDIIPYEDRLAETVTAMFQDWNAIRERTMAYLDRLAPEQMSEVVVRKHHGWQDDLTNEQVLFHLINHETHHRAQISMQLQQRGIDPPNFDFCLLHS